MKIQVRSTGSLWRYWGLMVMRDCAELYLGPVKFMFLSARYSAPPVKP